MKEVENNNDNLYDIHSPRKASYDYIDARVGRWGFTE